MTRDEDRAWIGTSWKMHKTRAEAIAFAEAVRAAPADPRVQRFVVPPFTTIRDVKAALDATDVRVGAQNMHWADAGAWTGEISAPMLVDCGVDMVELGHSERRANFGETDETVGLKVAAALRHGLTPLVCVGETIAQKDAGEADAALAAQVAAALGEASPSARVLFAYEPVWAIGAGGSPATPDYADARQARIKEVAADRLGAAPLVLYGGGVNAENCAELLTQAHIDGLFIGRAAWSASGYLDIVARGAAVLASRETTT